MTESFDAIVIGTGQAGPALAVRLAQTGRKTAILERNRFGGTCVNTGCIPTKTLIASARAAYVARRAADFGVAIDGAIRVDMPRARSIRTSVYAQVPPISSRISTNVTPITPVAAFGDQIWLVSAPSMRCAII